MHTYIVIMKKVFRTNPPKTSTFTHEWFTSYNFKESVFISVILQSYSIKYFSNPLKINITRLIHTKQISNGFIEYFKIRHRILEFCN